VGGGGGFSIMALSDMGNHIDGARTGYVEHFFFYKIFLPY